MNTCDTCSKWLPVEKSTYTLEYYGLQVGSGFCRKQQEEVLPSGVYFDGRAEDYTGEMVTGPKFGCIHHEALTTGAN